MDQFGVLVESIGFKAHGKSSAPLADLKGTNKINQNINRRPNSAYDANPSLNVDDLDGIFRSNAATQAPNSGFDHGGLGGDYLDSVFRVSNYDDDVFGLNKRTSVDYFDNKTNQVDDLLGNFGGMGMSNSNLTKSNGLKLNSVKTKDAASKSADLLSGFRIKPPSSNGRKSGTNPVGQSGAKSFSVPAEDPFVMMERAHGSSNANNGASDYLDSLFSSGNTSKTEDSVYSSLFNNNGGHKAEKKASTNITKKTSNGSGDFSYLFGLEDGIPSSGEFQEMKGESEDRRRARFNHHMTTRERMANALNEKNKRDLQAQREQDEKLRVAESLDGDIKRWAAGKEGNLRALLSSLEQVLWSGSGWQSISLTDLITSTAVKKAYYKATLCIHPDKVQQKGANVQQKYIAEKVFDLLKEAWNKFNAEEFKKQ